MDDQYLSPYQTRAKWLPWLQKQKQTKKKKPLIFKHMHLGLHTSTYGAYELLWVCVWCTAMDHDFWGSFTSVRFLIVSGTMQFWSSYKQKMSPVLYQCCFIIMEDGARVRLQYVLAMAFVDHHIRNPPSAAVLCRKPIRCQPSDLVPWCRAPSRHRHSPPVR